MAPHFLDGVFFWGKKVKFIFGSLFILQNRAVRLLTRFPKLSHADPVFNQDGCLNLNYNFIVEMFKVTHRDLYFNIFSDLLPRFSVQVDNKCSISDIFLTKDFFFTNLLCIYLKRISEPNKLQKALILLHAS